MQLKQLITLGLALGLLSCSNDSSPTKPSEPVLPDTTSHEFIWQIQTFGGGAGSSYLSDIAIVDENNIWAVGQIFVLDSTGQFEYPAYGAIHWNGTSWQLKRLAAPAQNRTVNLKPEGIFAFAADDIWLADGGVHHYDGQQIESFWVNAFPGNDDAILEEGQLIQKVWGNSSSNLWAIGRKGAIIHYDGQNWQKLDSGTDLDIQDIWGGRDPDTGEYTILAVASNIFVSRERAILRINNLQVERLPDSRIESVLSGVWFDPGKVYYVIGDGIYSKKDITSNEDWGGPGLLTVTTYFSRAIRGNHMNDIFVVGSFGDVLHYNGSSWRSYREQTALTAGSYREVAVQDDIICAVGSTDDRAVVLRGLRND